MNIKHYSAICATILSVVSTVSFAQEPSGPTPFPTDTNAFPGKGVVRVHPWMADNRNFFWSKRADSQGAIVFVGDSLLGNWKSPGKAFPSLKIANRAIGGDVSRNVLFRLKEDVLDLNPKAVVLLIGTNDLSARENIADAVSNINAILDAIAAKNAATPVVLCNLPPRQNPKAFIDNSQLLTLNQEIEKIAKARTNVTFVDLHKAMAKEDGTPDPQYFGADLLHPGAVGYEKIADVLKPVFEKLKLQ